MVRLVFRPYTHVWRTICTSVSLRSSTRVSPGFNLRKHSSPSFGSQHTCSSEYSSSEESVTADEEHLSVIIQSISLRLGVYNSRTRTYVRLLGPCFKTGRITTPIITSRWTNESRRKPKSIVPPWRKQKKSKSRLQTNKNNLSSVNQLCTLRTCSHEQ